MQGINLKKKRRMIKVSEKKTVVIELLDDGFFRVYEKDTDRSNEKLSLKKALDAAKEIFFPKLETE